MASKTFKEPSDAKEPTVSDESLAFPEP